LFKKIKQRISLLMVMMMVITVLPIQAFAEGEQPYKYSKYSVVTENIGLGDWDGPFQGSLGEGTGNDTWTVYLNYTIDDKSKDGIILTDGVTIDCYSSKKIPEIVSYGYRLAGDGTLLKITKTYGSEDFEYEYYTAKIGSGRTVKGELIETIEAIDGQYPSNGIHTDGYWYVKGSEKVVESEPKPIEPKEEPIEWTELEPSIPVVELPKGEPIIETKIVSIGSGTDQERNKIINLPEVKDIISVETDNGIVEHNLAGENLTVTVKDGDGYEFQTGGTLTPGDSKQVTAQTSINYNQDGYKGTLEKYVYSGTYIPSDTKYVTDFHVQNYNVNGYVGTLTAYSITVPSSHQVSKSISGYGSSSYSDSEGYSGSLSKYQTGGSYTPAETKYMEFKNIPYGANYPSSMPATPPWVGSVYATNATKTESGAYMVDYGGTLTKPAIDTRTWAYQGTVYKTVYTSYQDKRYKGNVTRSASDTRVYRYKGTVSKDPVDTRTYETRYDYEVTVKYVTNYKPVSQITAEVSKKLFSKINGYNEITFNAALADNDVNDKVSIDINIDGNKISLDNSAYTVSDSNEKFLFSCRVILLNDKAVIFEPLKSGDLEYNIARTPGEITKYTIYIKGLNEGIHTMSYEATDSKNYSVNVPINFAGGNKFEVDTTVPTIKTPAVEVIDQSRIKVTLEGTDKNNIKEYQINKNNADLDWSTDNIFIDKNLMANALYTYKYKAKDSIGNESVYSNTVSKHTLANDPIKVEKAGVTQTTLKLRIEEGENKKAPEYRLEVKLQGAGSDGENKRVSEWSPGNTKRILGLSVDDVYEVWLQTRNADGVTNSKYKVLDSVKLNMPPIIKINEIPNTLLRDNMEFSLEGTVDDPEKDTVEVSASIDGIKKTEIIDTNNSNAWKLTWNTSELSDGEYSIEVIADDSNAVAKEKWPNSLEVDKTAPTVNVPTIEIVGPGTLKISPNATDINGLSNTEVYLFNRNGIDLEWIDEALIDNLLEPNALYTYKYKAKDILGNTSDYSVETSKHTLAENPVKVEKGKVTQTTLEVKIQEGENKKAPEYRLEVKLQGAEIDGENKAVSEWAPGEIKEFENLSVDDVYEVWLQTRNADGVTNAKYKALDGVKLNTPPIIKINEIPNTLLRDNMEFSLSGSIDDQENDMVIIKAVIDGIEKSIAVDTNQIKEWQLTWNTSELSERKFEGIEIVADDSNALAKEKWPNVLTVDKTPPTKPTIEITPEGPTNQDVTVTIQGAHKYRINEGEWVDYKAPLTVGANCNVEAIATDQAGNSSTIIKTISNIDKTPPAPPVIKLSAEELTNKDITVTIVGGSQYKIDNGQWQIYREPFVVVQNCTIKATISDGVGNTSTVTKIVNNIDKVPPKAPIINVTPEHLTNQKVTVTITGASELKMDNQWMMTKSSADSTNKFEVDHNCTVEARAVDAAGNVAVSSKKITNIDTTPPAKPKVDIHPQEKTYGDVEIIAKGGNLIRVDGGEWVNYKSPFTVSENCKVEIKAVDPAGNETITEKVINNIKEHHHRRDDDNKDEEKDKTTEEEESKEIEGSEDNKTSIENIWFKDIKGHWAENNIMHIAHQKVVEGYPDHTFRPNNTLTVKEFLTCVVRAKNLEVERIEGKNWFEPYKKVAIKNGYVKQGEFSDYNRQITRAEMSRVIVRALDFEVAADKAIYSKLIKDYKIVPENLKEYVVKAYKLEIINGYEDGNFKPFRGLSRAETTAVLERMLKSEQQIANK